MTACLNKYKVRKEKGLWNEPSEEQNKIIALQTQVNQLKRKNKSGSNNSNTNNNTGGGGNSPTRKKKKKPDWCFKAPGANDPKEKSVNGKTWWWCPNHKEWCRHKPEDCKGICSNKPSGNNQNQGGNDRNNQAQDDMTLEDALVDRCDISVLSE